MYVLVFKFVFTRKNFFLAEAKLFGILYLIQNDVFYTVVHVLRSLDTILLREKLRVKLVWKEINLFQISVGHLTSNIIIFLGISGDISFEKCPKKHLKRESARWKRRGWQSVTSS